MPRRERPLLAGKNQGGLPRLTIGFSSKVLIQFILKTVAPHEAVMSPILDDEVQERSDGSTTAHSSKIISNNTLNVL